MKHQTRSPVPSVSTLSPVKSFTVWFIFFLVVLGAVAWLPAIGGKHFDDDYLFVFIGEKSVGLWRIFTHKSPISEHYRPMEAAMLIWAQGTLGLRNSAYLIQSLAMVCHIATAVLGFLGLTRF